ncbi:hypothetical protein Ae201684P_002472 [Aphanomyces euteiches]|uniref:Uncharacterized protein n=1 Tax=Aphanomyces euteiches TaxID=100861 RepID=A0A6G0X5D3_9STRA|nr:hypothetical protein Ae201684_008372 [Aphanomyces euteiches]KAH9070102.1 hypothetical protein Ae201684P_002472 [Aphanomyces euteiches]
MRPPPPRPITKADYAALIQSDVELYPTDNPLTPSVLSKWFLRHPEFGMIYESFGCCIFVPLVPQTWQKFIDKEIEEVDLVDGIFDATATTTGELCLHLYHIEKTDKWTREFDRMAQVAIQDVRMIIHRLNSTCQGGPAIHVTGCSALTASPSGFKMTRDVFQMKVLHAPQEVLYRHRLDGHISIFQVGDVVSDDEWDKIGEVQLMANKDQAAALFA